ISLRVWCLLCVFFFFSSRRRHTRSKRDWSSDVCSSDLLFPEFAEGTIACREHAMMARNGEITIRVQGKSAHGAQPQLGHDAILAAAAIIQGLHTILSRNVSPLAAGVLTFGKITGGEAMNIIAGQVQIEGTMRSFSDQTYQTMVERVTEVVEMTAKAYGCKAIVEFNHMYRVVDNDPQM